MLAHRPQLSTTSAILPTYPAFLSRLNPHFAVLLALPLVLLSINANWFYDPTGTIDPWVYYGFFTHLRHFKVDLFPGTYYGSRLSYVLPGYVLNQVFRPLAANLILHLGLFYVSLFSLYSIFRRINGRRAALLACILCGTYHFFLTAIGWDYVDGAGIAYYLITVALLTKAGDARWPFVWLTLAGAAYAGLVYCNIFWFVFSPFFLVLLLFVKHKPLTAFGDHLASVFWFTSGVLGLSVFLGGINFLIERTVWFYSPSLHYAVPYLSLPNRWRLYTFAWLSTSSWLLLPAATFVGTLGYIVVNWRGGKRRSLNLVFKVNYVASVLLLVAFELKGTPIFEYEFKTSHLIPPMFLALGALFSRGADRLKPRVFAGGMVVLFGIMTFPMWHLHAFTDGRTVPYVLAVGLVAGVIGLLVHAVWRERLVALGVCVIGLGVLQETTTINSLWLGLNRQSRKGDFSRVVEGMEVIDAIVPESRIFFWYNEKERNGFLFSSLNSIYLWGYTWIGREFPSLLESRHQSHPQVATGQTVILLSSDQDAFKLAVPSLRERHLSAQKIAQVAVGKGDDLYYIIMLRTSAEVSSTLPVAAVFGDQSKVDRAK